MKSTAVLNLEKGGALRMEHADEIRQGDRMTWVRTLESQRTAPVSPHIRNDCVVDGTGGPAPRVDVAVESDRVAAFDAALRGDAPRVIDAAGHVVAPRF